MTDASTEVSVIILTPKPDPGLRSCSRGPSPHRRGASSARPAWSTPARRTALLGWVESTGRASYEPHAELRLRRDAQPRQRVIEVLDASREDPIIERCIRAASFEQVSNRPRREEDANPFFRKGIAGDWREVFTERDREIYKELAGNRLVELGYENSLHW